MCHMHMYEACVLLIAPSFALDGLTQARIPLDVFGPGKCSGV